MTRRPVLPGASELFFRRTDAASGGAAPAPVSELPSLAAAAASPALRGNAGRRSPEPEVGTETHLGDAAPPLQLVRAAPDDELAGIRAALPVTGPAPRRRSSRERTRHEEKITVYCSAEELLAIEGARLILRGQHGVVADRGRIVREALAVLLADLDANGEDSVLVRRLRTS